MMASIVPETTGTALASAAVSPPGNELARRYLDRIKNMPPLQDAPSNVPMFKLRKPGREGTDNCACHCHVVVTDTEGVLPDFLVWLNRER